MHPYLVPWTEGTLIPLGFQQGNLELASDYALLPQHKPTCKIKTITLEKVGTNQPVLNNKYKYIYIYTHAKLRKQHECRRNGDQTHCLFSSVGNAASRSVVIPTYGPQLASTSFQSTEKRFSQVSSEYQSFHARVFR